MRAGLKNLRRGLARKAGADLLRGLVAASPDFKELWGIWDVQITLQQQPIIVELLGAMMDLVRTRRSTQEASAQHTTEHLEDSTSTGPTELASDTEVHQCLDELAYKLLKQKMKAVYFHLTSDSRARINAALFLLAAVCSRGQALTRQLLASFDTQLSSLPKIARPPRSASAPASVLPVIGPCTVCPHAHMHMGALQPTNHRGSLAPWCASSRSVRA